MSTYWGYYCAACDDSTDTWLNHGEDRLRELAAAAPVIWPLMEQEGYGNAFELRSMWEGLPLGLALGWLKQHAGHEISLLDEYGGLEPLNLQEPQRQFQILFTVSGAERRQIQERYNLPELPDSWRLGRLFREPLQALLRSLIAGSLKE